MGLYIVDISSLPSSKLLNIVDGTWGESMVRCFKSGILRVHNLTLTKKICSFNNYQIINPIIIPYAFNHKY
jgi:hypothetical protein